MEKPVKIKYQTEEITILSGSNSLEQTQFNADDIYDEIIGVTLIPKSAPNDFSGVPSGLLVGITDDSGTVQERTPIADYMSGLGVAPADRYKPMSIQAKGNRISIETLPAAALGSDFTFYVVLKLAKYQV